MIYRRTRCNWRGDFMDRCCPAGCGIFSDCREVELALRLRVSNARGATLKSNLYVNQPEDTRYFFADVDGRGQPLNGNNRYTVTFPKGQAVNSFWSLAMHDKYYFFVPNPIKRYLLRAKNKTLKPNPDGSLTICVQNESPGADKESNWLGAPRRTSSP